MIQQVYPTVNHPYTFELNKKLQPHRMGDTIDSRNIEKIEVNL